MDEIAVDLEQPPHPGRTRCSRNTALLAWRRQIRFTASFLVLTAACAGPGGKEAQNARSPSGGTVRVGLSGLGALDPARATGPASLSFLRAACDSITALDPASGDPEPALATSWSFHRGAQRLSVRLKEGLLFGDGSPVDSHAVRESLSRVARPATSSPWSHLVSRVVGFPEVQSGAATHLSGVKTFSASRLEIELSKPFSDFPTVLAHPGLTPVSPESLVASDGGSELPVCSGPYRIATEESGNRYRLVRRGSRQSTGTGDLQNGRPQSPNGVTGTAGTRSPSSAEIPASADVIIVRNYDTLDDAYAAYKAGEVDLSQVPEAEIGEAQVRRGFDRQPGPQVALLAFDATKPPTDNAAVRQAISLAVDRLVLIDAAFPDQRPPALRWLPEALGREAGSACKELIRKVANPDEAKERLAQGGAQVKEPIPLIFDGAKFGRLVAQAIELQVQDVLGLDLNPQPMDAEDFEVSLKERSSAGIWLMNTSVHLPIADEVIGDMFATGSSANVMGFSDPKVDAAIEKARKATTQSEAARVWVEAENEVCDKMPAVPMWRTSAQWIRNPARISVDGDSMLDFSGGPALRALRGTSG